MLTSSVIALLGLVLGWLLYGRTLIPSADAPDRLESLQPGAFATLTHAFYVDAIYAATLIRVNKWWSLVCDWFDRWIWNGAVYAISWLVLGLAWFDHFFDTFVVNTGFDEGCEGVAHGGHLLSRLQGGRIQTYLRIIGCALIALIVFLLWGAKA